jgi:hypothetical protein
MHLPISPTSLTELGRGNVKKFHTNAYFVQHSGERIVLTSQDTMVLLVGTMSQWREDSPHQAEDRFLLIDEHGSLGDSYEPKLPSFCSLSSLSDTA